MKGPELLRILGDPGGPDVVTSELTDKDLARLLDALFRNLDAPVPETHALVWYETGVGESLRREASGVDAG